MAKQSGWEKWRNKKAKQALRKIHKSYLTVAALCLLFGIGIGVLGGWFFTLNDKFELNGEKNITISVGDQLSYTDEGVTCVSNGKTQGANTVEITTNMHVSEDGKTFSADTSIEGEYYIQYTVKSGRYAGLSRVRRFTVTAASADIE